MDDSIQKQQNILAEQRVSDEDRRKAVERLSELCSEGYLDVEEFGARQDAALQAKTLRDLKPLFKDLPKPAEIPDALIRAPEKTTAKPGSLQKSPRLLNLMLVIVLVALWVISMVAFLTGHIATGQDSMAAMVILALWTVILKPKRRK